MTGREAYEISMENSETKDEYNSVMETIVKSAKQGYFFTDVKYLSDYTKNKLIDDCFIVKPVTSIVAKWITDYYIISWNNQATVTLKTVLKLINIK